MAALPTLMRVRESMFLTSAQMPSCLRPWVGKLLYVGRSLVSEHIVRFPPKKTRH